MKLSFYTCVAVAMLPACGGAPFIDDPIGTSNGGPLTAVEASSPVGVTVDSGTSNNDAGAPSMAPQEASAEMPDAGNNNDACPLVTHNDGLGGLWEDCTPQATYTPAEAYEACLVFQAAHPELTGLYPCTIQEPGLDCSPKYVDTWLVDPDAGPNQQIVWIWIFATEPGTLNGGPGDVVQYSDTWAGPCILPPSAGHWQ